MWRYSAKAISSRKHMYSGQFEEFSHSCFSIISYFPLISLKSPSYLSVISHFLLISHLFLIYGYAWYWSWGIWSYDGWSNYGSSKVQSNSERMNCPYAVYCTFDHSQIIDTSCSWSIWSNCMTTRNCHCPLICNVFLTWYFSGVCCTNNCDFSLY